MTIANVTLTNTFDEWRTTTNQLIGVYDETNTLAVAAYNSTNSVTFTAANLAANVLVSNTIILSAITDTVNVAVPIVMTTNTQVITLITDSANGVASSIDYTSIVVSNSTIRNSINVTAAAIASNAMVSNTTILTLISDSANTTASNIDYAGVILANASIMNEINLAASAAASNAIVSNTTVIATIYNNANTIVEGFVANTDVGAAFVQANTAYLVANAAFNKANSSSNTFSSNVVISVTDNSNAALRITQTGTAYALLVEDNTNPDATPFVIDANGFVGIANTSPGHRLAVQGSSYISGTLGLGTTTNPSASKLYMSAASNPRMATIQSTDADSSAGIGLTNDAREWAISIRGDLNDSLAVRDITTNEDRLVIDANGTVSATTFNSLSDYNLKTNIIHIGGALDTINSLNGVSFEWKNNGKRSYGVIAQDIEKHIPDLVGNVDGTKNVNYDGIIAFLIEAIKELNRKLDAK